MLRDRSAASSSVVAILMASLLFLGSIGAILHQSRDTAITIQSDVEGSMKRQEAVSLADMLLTSPGYDGVGDRWGIDGQHDGDALVRLGLRDPNGTYLSYDKFDNLRRAPFAADATDGHVNYEEAVGMLGLQDQGMDFHIRAYPTLKSIQQILRDGYKDPNMQVAYIGDYSRSSDGSEPEPDEGLFVGPLTCKISAASDHSYRLNFTLLNGGTTTTQFVVYFDVDFDGDGILDVEEVTNTFLVPNGGLSDVYLDVPRTSGRTCSGSTTVDLQIYDVSTRLRSVEAQPIADILGTPDAASKDLQLDTSKSYFERSEDIRLDYTGDVAKDDVLNLTIREGNSTTATPVHEAQHAVPGGQGQRYVELSSGTLDPGHYTAYLHFDGTDEPVATERVLVVEDGTEVDPYTPSGSSGEYKAHDAVEIEVGFLETLVEQFCPYEFDSTSVSPMDAPPTWADRCQDFKAAHAQPGDVFPDIKKVMDNDLPERLLDGSGVPRYDITNTLVVGSGIDHNTMTSSSAKHAVRDWVLGGGTLIVFGSNEQNVQWLQPLFHSGIQGSSGGISTPDESHPLLHTPDDLNYDSYDHRDHVWRLNAGADEHFTNVIEQDSDPVTAVSDPGDFGNGTIILSTWMPYDIFGDGEVVNPIEGMKLVNNFLTLGYRTLYLDYGPPLPSGVEVVPSISKAIVLHPKLGFVTLDIVVFAFPGNSVG